MSDFSKGPELGVEIEVNGISSGEYSISFDKFLSFFFSVEGDRLVLLSLVGNLNETLDEVNFIGLSVFRLDLPRYFPY